MDGLSGGVALITGGASGIGRAVAARLNQEGMRLALIDLQEDSAKEAAESFGGEHLALGVDVRDDIAVQQGVETVINHFGRIDTLVNAAGVSRAADFLHVSPDDFDLVVATNLRGTFSFCQSVGRHMVERRAGSIVNVASITGKKGAAHLAVYSATKAGVIALTQAAAASFGAQGVRVNAVCPGMIWTPMFERSAQWISQRDERYRNSGLTPREIYDEMVKGATLLKRATEPEEVASAVVFLASEEASGMTGQALNVDGGMQFH
jgi:NAD(P)-dependent dehydrogenase (short-subunit alcohol dehydrogenase family)